MVTDEEKQLHSKFFDTTKGVRGATSLEEAKDKIREDLPYWFVVDDYAERKVNSFLHVLARFLFKGNAPYVSDNTFHAIKYLVNSDIYGMSLGIPYSMCGSFFEWYEKKHPSLSFIFENRRDWERMGGYKGWQEIHDKIAKEKEEKDNQPLSVEELQDRLNAMIEKGPKVNKRYAGTSATASENGIYHSQWQDSVNNLKDAISRIKSGETVTQHNLNEGLT